MAPQQINWAIYHSLPPEEAQYQLTHINDNRRASTAATYAICLPIAFAAIVVRFVSRRIGRVSYGQDDWMIIVAYIFALFYATAALMAALKYGGGRHVILMTEDEPAKFAKALLAAQVLYAPAIACIKISTLLLFARIFPNVKFRRVLWAIGIFVLTYTAVSVLVDTFQCRPIEGVWNLTIHADCIQIKSFWIVMGTMNVLTDFALLLAPVPQLWALQIRRDTKIGLIGIFSIGGFVTIASIYRIPKLNEFSTLDAGWSARDASTWSIVEICVAIVCASTITYRPLFIAVFHFRSSSLGPTTRMAKPNATGSPYPNDTLIQSASSKGADVSMHVLKPVQSHDISWQSGHGDGFHRMGDSIDM